MTDYFARMRQLIGTTAEWAANDLVIGLGEFAVEIAGPLHNRLKMGDGINRYSALPYYDPGINQFVKIAGDTMTGPLAVPQLDVTGPATFTGAVDLGTAATVHEPPSLSDADTSVPTTHWVQQQIGGVITGLHLRGTWNASTNDPTLASGGAGTPPATRGDFYLVSVAGTTTLDGISSWAAGDSCVFNGVTWQKVPQTLNYAQIIGGLGYVPANDADAIKRQIVDAAGDLIVGTANDTVARFAKGTANQVLTSTASGIAWSDTRILPGVLTLYSEQVAAGGEKQLNVTIPPNCKRLELQISYFVASGDLVGKLQSVVSGTPNAANNHNIQQLFGTEATAAAATVINTFWDVGGGLEVQSTIQLYPRGGGAGAQWAGTADIHMIAQDGRRIVWAYAFDGGASVATTTGFRLTLGTSSLQVGSYMRAYVIV